MTQETLASSEAIIAHGVDIEAIVGVLREQGFVVLEDALSPALLEDLRERFQNAFEAKRIRLGIVPVTSDGNTLPRGQALPDFQPSGGNHDINRWNMHLPSARPFLDERVLANPIAMAAIERITGPGSVAFLLGSDTPMPGSSDQNPHQDMPRCGYIVTIPLIDFTRDNGALEIWPGTHRPLQDGALGPFTTADVWLLRRSRYQALLKCSTPKLLLARAGSLIIRDQRLLHRGTRNLSARPRPCLTLWYKCPGRFSLASMTMPTPHRAVCDWAAERALRLRRSAVIGGAVADRRLLNLGNFWGRFVDEVSLSDRDHRRVISPDLWAALGPRGRRLLRYATVAAGADEVPRPRRSVLGSCILIVMFTIVSLWGLVLRMRPRHRREPALRPD